MCVFTHIHMKHIVSETKSRWPLLLYINFLFSLFFFSVRWIIIIIIINIEIHRHHHHHNRCQSSCCQTLVDIVIWFTNHSIWWLYMFFVCVCVCITTTSIVLDFSNQQQKTMMNSYFFFFLLFIYILNMNKSSDKNIWTFIDDGYLLNESY